MKHRIALTALLLFGLVPTYQEHRAQAQVQNPWNPFAAPRPGTPGSGNGAKKPAPDSSAQPANPAIPGDQPPLLRPMTAVPPDNQANQTTAPGAAPAGHPAPNRPFANPQSGPTSLPAIERADLAPVVASDGSGLPYELWRGLDLESVERLLATLEIPPRSQALHALWVRLITSRATISNDPRIDQKFAALRQQALYRSGLVVPAADNAASSTLGQPAPGDDAAGQNPVIAVLTARADIVLGDPQRGCATVRRIDVNTVPDALKPETILLFGYCAVAAGNTAAAQMAGDLARENGLDSSPALAALDALAHGSPVELPAKGTITGLTYRLLEKANHKPDADLIKRAEPALLVALVRDRNLQPGTRLLAAEAAMRINAIKPKTLADLYTQVGAAAPRENSQSSSWSAQQQGSGQTDDPSVRATLFAKLESEFTPFKKARLVRSFLDDARRAGLYLPALQMVHSATDTLQPVPEISWFSETAIEIALASNDFQRARSWAGLSSRLDNRSTGNLDHWLALIDIANSDQTTPRGENLKSVENMALNGRFGSKQLHRLATVLDALEYHVPIPLWQAASNTPQPTGGHLPQSGVLTRLQDAAKNREFGRTVLLAMQTLGPNGAEGAHMIALGDGIRALKRAGLERDARRLGFEALFAAWPRLTSR